MKKLTFVIVAVLIALNITSCNKCDGEDPEARIVNNGTETASVQIKTTGGNTVNLNNIDPGEESEYVSYAPGEVVFTITVKQMELIDTVEMSTCYYYDIMIDSTDNINTISIER